MSKITLAALLDEDKEMVLANIARDRSLAAAQAALEKEIDRVLYRYVENCGDAVQRDGAQHLLQAIKNTLPVMDAVGEARVWKKEYDDGRRRAHMTPVAGALLAAGLVMVLASVLGVLIAGRGGAFAFVKALVPVIAGCACLYFGGVQSMRPKKDKAKPADAEPTRTEYLVDAEKAWHCLRGAIVQADGQLERVREASAAQRRQADEAAQQGPLDPAAVELFSELLEAAYASGEEGAREAASSIRFYLHNAKIDVIDYAEGREAWFEFLPASRPGTIRPALISNGKVIKKGIASGRSGNRE